MPKLPPAPLTRTLCPLRTFALPQELQGLAAPVGYGRSLLVAQVRRHRRDRPGLGVLAQADVLRVGSQPDARRREDPVALPERPDIFAYRLDVTGKLLPEHGLPRSADAERQPHGQPDPGGEVESPQLAIGRAHRRGADSNQHFVVLRNGLRHVPELKDIRWSVDRCTLLLSWVSGPCVRSGLDPHETQEHEGDDDESGGDGCGAEPGVVGEQIHEPHVGEQLTPGRVDPSLA